MARRALTLVLALILLAVLTPVGVGLADYTAEECADGEWEVRPNQTLYSIAYICGTTVDALVAYNNIENPNLIRTGQILLLPPADFEPTGGAPSAAPAAQPTVSAPAPAPRTSGTGGVIVEFGEPLYSGDGRVVEVPITVHNLSVTPGIAGGRYYPGYDRDTPGGPRWVTLLGAVHDTIPYPYVTNEPLWHATVYTDDGLSFPAYVGCRYQETVYAQGDEPLSRADNIWFHWEVTLPGGWFDCGNAYQVKPENLLPGQSGSAPLTVYLIHPRLWNSVPTVDRRIVRIDLELFDTEGRSLGIVASQTFN